MRRKWLPVRHPPVFAVSPSAKHNFAFAAAAGITGEDEAYFVEPVPSGKPRDLRSFGTPFRIVAARPRRAADSRASPSGLRRVSHRVDISPLFEHRSAMIRDKITFSLSLSPLGFASSRVARSSGALSLPLYAHRRCSRFFVGIVRSCETDSEIFTIFSRSCCFNPFLFVACSSQITI